MTINTMMRTFPASEQTQVDLSNWRTAPFNRWAFHHVREIVPNSNIAAAPQNSQPLESAASRITQVSFEGLDGEDWTWERLLKESSTDGLVVLQQGQLVAEWYDNGYQPLVPHIVFSVSKSISAAVAGILTDRGQLDPSLPVTHYLPEAEGSAYGDCTVQHVLDMTVSLAFEESYLDPTGDFARYRAATGWNPPMEGVEADLRGFLCSLPKDSHAHGEVFAYASPNSDLLGWIIERAAQRRFSDLLSELIWQPMGAMVDGYITVDPLGAPRTAGGICVGLYDLARFGDLMRCRGMANGQQILPGWWVDDTLTQGSREAWLKGNFLGLLPEGKYRNKWYQIGNDRGAYMAIGIHGQWIYVDPASDVVIAKVSSGAQPLDEPLELAQLRAFDALARHLG
ncbi:serine hydrolase domain-containing protein [Rhodovibrionaceae bacterium A322]